MHRKKIKLNPHRHAAANQQRDYLTYTIRLPLDLADAIRREAARRFEPQSVLVRRLVAIGLHADQHQVTP